MSLDDFGLSVLASLFANKLEAWRKPAATDALISDDFNKMKCTKNTLTEDRPVKFKTLDAWNDLSRILRAVKAPLISVLIEDEPSTYYRLASLVVESKTTGEWFVFSRGRMSFEGTGGGIRNSEIILNQVKKAGAEIGVWVLPQAQLYLLDNGYDTWPTIKVHAIPLLARIAEDYSWNEISRNVSKHLGQKTSR